MKSLSKKIKNKINEELHEMNDYHSEIPLHKIVSIVEAHGVCVLQKDGTKFKGFLTGSVGSIMLNISQPIKLTNIYTISSTSIMILWYQMANGNFKIISYIA